MIGKKTSCRWVMLSFSFAIAFLLHLLLFSTAPMVSVIMTDMSLSYAGFGFLFSAAMISLVLFRIPWGLIGDRIGYLNVFRITLPISAAFALLRAVSPTYLTFVLSQFFLGAALAAVLPCLPLIVKEWSQEKLGLSTGVYVSGFAVGNATALALTPFMLQAMGWRDILLTYGIVALVMSGFWWVFAGSSVKKVSGYRLESFAGVLRIRYVWVLLFFMIASMGSYDTLATWMPKVLEMKALDKALASLLPLGFFVSGPLIGSALDKFENRKLIIALLGVVAAASIVGINYAPFSLLLVCVFLSGFATIGVLTISLTTPLKDGHLSGSTGGVVGLISSLGNIGPLIMPVLFGFLIDLTGTFHLSILSVALLAGITFIIGSRSSYQNHSRA